MPTPAKRTFRRWKNLPSRRLALIVSIAVFILLSAGSIWTTYSNYSTQKQHLIHYASQQEINSFKSSQKALRINADVVFTSAINQDDILSLMAKAYHGDAAVRNEMRETLYNRLEPLYRLLKSEYIRQLHFHLPDSSSFLRFTARRNSGTIYPTFVTASSRFTKPKSRFSGLRKAAFSTASVMSIHCITRASWSQCGDFLLH